MIKALICTDRDGTLVYDAKGHLFLGRDNEWKSKVKILPHVIDGIKVLNTIPDSVLYMITNQAGVAISDFPLLTLERAHEVCRYIIEMIKDMGGHIDGYFLCPHANRAYVEQHGRYHFDEKLVCECNCIKPGAGMVFDALKSEKASPEGPDIYVIGDRATDVETALEANGTGVLVPFENQPGEDEKVKKLKDRSHIFIARSMLEAADFIARRYPI
jgi:histidinol-phosphate phosphatase family protein